MKRSIKKIVLGLVFGTMLVPSSYVWAKTGRTNTAGQWKMEEKHWTFLNEQGNKLTGWIVSNEEWYYLGENGDMLVDTTTPDGYKVDKEGVYIA